MESKSPKEIQVEEKITALVTKIVDEQTFDDDLPLRLWNYLQSNQEIAAIQDYANIVSIGRLGLNDHGPVHMKIVCRNALKMLNIIHAVGVKTSLEKENVGSFADSVAAVMLASLLHDSGMTIGRNGHELYSGIISYSIIEKVLSQLLPETSNILRRTIIRSIAMEGIIGHMATHPIHSIEAGLILIADGCDMTKGRARIPLEIPSKPTEGDIHKYSANSIEKVKIEQGHERPLKIEIHMKAEVGFFQVEEVLIPKIQSSPAKNLLELYAGVDGEEMKRYI
jgi:metal-dependent HD superfamily phosphatase/phosphodiesterase